MVRNIWYSLMKSLERPGAELAVNVNVDVRLTDIDTHDVVSN